MPNEFLQFAKNRKSRADLREDFKLRGINWYLPTVGMHDFETRLQQLITDCDNALTELNKEAV